MGPARANFADSMRHVESLHFYRYFHRFSALMGVCGRLCCPHWACLGPSVQHAPTQDQVAHAKPNLRPNVPPSCAMLKPSWAQVAPSWAQVAPKLEPTGPSSQVGSCSAQLKGPRTARFDPSRLWLGQVRPLLSSLSNSLGAGGSRREATRIR